MPIEPTPAPEEKKPGIEIPVQEDKQEPQKPLLQITLPAPTNMDPKAPLSVGQHNACAQRNFKQVADILQAIINNQKLMGLAVTQLDKTVKQLQENNKTIAENINKLLKENNKNGNGNPVPNK